MLTKVRQTIDRYRNARAIVIGYGFFAHGGAWKSIYNFYTHLTSKGESIILIPQSRRSPRQLRIAFLFGRNCIVNGLDAFYRWRPILFCLLKPNTVVYFHETKFVLDAFSKSHPRHFACVKKIMRRNKIACVSQAQEGYLRETYGAKRTSVVYENIINAAPIHFDPEKTHVLMVGSIEKRKGTSLFSELADEARKRGLNWEFHYVGSPGSTEGVYLSQNVNWHGQQPTAAPFLQQADLFLLSSLDDPFPLACLESLALFKRVVVYKNTGIAEIIRGISGCGVYEEHSVEGAWPVIEKALGEPLDTARARFINEQISHPEAFSKRMLAILDDRPTPVPQPPQAVTSNA